MYLPKYDRNVFFLEVLKITCFAGTPQCAAMHLGLQFVNRVMHLQF